MKPCVDNLAHTPALIATEVRGLPRFDAAGAAISDHSGVVVDLTRADGDTGVPAADPVPPA